MIKHVRIKAALALLCALLGNLFFYRQVGHMGIALVFTLLFLFEVAVSWQEIQEYRLRGTIGFLGLTLFLLLVNSVRTGNEFVAFTQFAGSFILLGLVFYLTTSGKKAFGTVFELILSPFRSGLRYAKGFFKALELSLNRTAWARLVPGKGMVTSWLRPLVFGLGVGVPLTLIIIGLLTSGDPIFKHFIASLKLPQLPKEIIGRIELTLVFCIFLLPIACVSVERHVIHPFARWANLHLAREMTVVVCLVTLVLGIFLVVQAPYVFARVAFETDLSKFGVATYSEYVRKGFGELVTVVFLVYGVLWGATTALRLQKTKKERTVLFWISTILFGLTLVFIFSISRRVYLYQLYHGWSLIRLYGMWLLLWITALFTTLALRQHPKIRVSLVNAELIMSFAFLIAFGAWNAESFIVKTHPPTVNSRVDYTYLARLSSDGIDGWEKAYQFAQETLSEKKLEEQNMIGMEDRRDVAYSSHILARLLDQYRRLVMQVGSLEEKRAFIHRVYKEYIPDMPVAKVNGWIADMDKGIVAPEQLNALLLPSYNFYWPGAQYFNESYGQNHFESIYFFADREKLIFGRHQTFLDRAYVWSGSKASALRAMQQTMSFDSLLNLYQTYLRLFHKIRQQPEGERGFVSDVSFSTPFAE
jgi:hypothetical protein